MSRVAERGREAASAAAFVCHHLLFNVQVALAYRVSFVLQVLFMVVNDLMLLFFWWILFQRVPSVGGWGSRETMLLVGISAGAFGLSVVVTGNVPRLARLIAEGQLDVYLVLPRDPLLHALVGRSLVAGIGDMIFAAGTIVLLGPPAWTDRLLLGVAVVASAAIFSAFGVLAHALAFWIGNSAGLSTFLHEALLTLGMYPESIYPAHIRALLFTLIPAGFCVHVPLAIVQQHAPHLLGYLLAFSLLLARLAWLVFRSGLARYQSGNLIQARL